MNTVSRVADKSMGNASTSIAPQPKTDPSRLMKALIWNGAKDIRYVDKPRPMITDPADIVLKITATTICGSDLHLYTNAMLDMQQGDILGHEFMGIVDEVGPEVKTVKKGDRVVVAFDIACGMCSYCQREEYTACDTTNPSKLMEYMYNHRISALYGYSHLTGGVPGGQSQYVRVPFADFNVLKLPEDVPDDKALYLSDIVPTSYHGTELANVQKGSTVGIWGLGPVGLLAARWCQIRGASRIIGIETVPARIDVAKRILGIEVIDFKKDKVVEKINELVPGGLDCTIECAGFEYSNSMVHKVERALQLETDACDILTEMIYCTRKFGNMSVIGVYAGFTNHFPIGAWMEKHITMKGGQSPTQKHWKMCLEKIRSGEMDPLIVVTHRASLSKGPELYNTFYKKEDGCIKVFLRP